jgi:catalase
LSRLARPGDGGIRTRKIALLVADGIEGASLGKLVAGGCANGERRDPWTT